MYAWLYGPPQNMSPPLASDKYLKEALHLMVKSVLFCFKCKTCFKSSVSF